MVNWLDRELQKQFLIELSEIYPEQKKDFYESFEQEGTDKISQNLVYLGDQGLIKLYKSVKVGRKQTYSGSITCKGIDFLEEDGGISAILSTITVRLHADTIRTLIETKITESEVIPENEKPALREALKGMKEEGLKQLTTRLVGHSLDKGAITAQQLWQLITG